MSKELMQDLTIAYILASFFVTVYNFYFLTILINSYSDYYKNFTNNKIIEFLDNALTLNIINISLMFPFIYICNGDFIVYYQFENTNLALICVFLTFCGIVMNIIEWICKSYIK